MDLRHFGVVKGLAPPPGTPLLAAVADGSHAAGLASQDEAAQAAFFLEPRPGTEETRVRAEGGEGVLFVRSGERMVAVQRWAVDGSPGGSLLGRAAGPAPPPHSSLAPPPSILSQRWEFRAIELADVEGWLEVFAEFGCSKEDSLLAELRGAAK